MDKKAVESNSQHLTLARIAEMSSEGVPDDVIIDEIRSTGSIYKLTDEIIEYLRENNVSEEVIDYMKTTGN